MPDGKPWNKDYYRIQLNKMGKMVWNYFHPYVFRDWCDIARLIHNNFEIQNVKDWFDHVDYGSVSHYTKDVHKYYRMAPFDWIKSILKSNKNIVGEVNRLNSKEGRKRALLKLFSPVGKIRTHGGH